MPILYLILLLAILGVVMYLINKHIPMDEPYKKLLNWVVIIAVVIWLLREFGVFGYLRDVSV